MPPIVTKCGRAAKGRDVPRADIAMASMGAPSCPQVVEQGLSLSQIERVEAFGEPAVDRSEQIAGLITLALIAPKPRHAHCSTQLPGPGSLLTCDRKRAIKIRF